jgi:signal transduction histidine kinase
VNEELEDYAKLVSHELRTPLSGIFLALEYLERLAGTMSPQGLDSEMSSIVESAKEAVSTTEHNVDRLLKLARAGQVPEDIDDVDVSSVVRDLLRSLEDEAKRVGASFDADDDLGVIRADPLHVHLIFSNLISNALKYCDSPSPLIEVRILDGSQALGNRYLVKDNGSGLPPEFEGELTESPRLPRSGLGLAIVGKIVKAYGGSATACNDEGARIEFVLHDYPLQPPRRMRGG